MSDRFCCSASQASVGVVSSVGGGFRKILCISAMCFALGVECVLLFIALMVVLTFRRCVRSCLYVLLLVVLEVARLVAPPLYGMRVPYGNRLTYFPKCDLPGLR